jgi:hypothetical protein
MLKDTLKLSGSGQLSPEVEGWLKDLTAEQKGGKAVAMH